MKVFTRFLLLIAAVFVIGLFGFADDVLAQTCLHSGCNRKCVSGDRYCYRHKTSSMTKKNSTTIKNSCKNNSKSKKGSGTSKNSKEKKLINKSYYTDYMPDCDDYENWGEFMDDWDGNMPDGSDASDYWDNW